MANVAVSVALLPLAAMFGVLELGSVDRSQCNWETFARLCSDYKGTYGVVAVTVLLLWGGLTMLINRTPNTHVGTGE